MSELKATMAQLKTIKRLIKGGGFAYNGREGAVYVDCADGIAWIGKDGETRWQR